MSDSLLQQGEARARAVGNAVCLEIGCGGGGTDTCVCGVQSRSAAVFIAQEINRLLSTAISNEREACARVAESQQDVHNLGNAIAGEIRKRGK